MSPTYAKYRQTSPTVTNPSVTLQVVDSTLVVLFVTMSPTYLSCVYKKECCMDRVVVLVGDVGDSIYPMEEKAKTTVKKNTSFPVKDLTQADRKELTDEAVLRET